jgi:hypothetical protein
VQIWWILLLVAGCGRAGFDPIDTDAGSIGATAPTCADVDLGSALGPRVATGTTASGRNQIAGCEGGDGNEITHAWVAPASGRYVIDTCASDVFWDSVLYVREGGCDGETLACDHSGCDGPTGFHGRIVVDLAAGSGSVIVVDSIAPTFDGTYVLRIEKL